jgi:hypothetical protein
MVDWIKKTDESGLAKFENMQLMLSKALCSCGSTRSSPQLVESGRLGSAAARPMARQPDPPAYSSRSAGCWVAPRSQEEGNGHSA